MRDSSSAQGGKLAFINFIAGTAGGIATVYVGQPGDTIKVKMQTFPSIYKDRGMIHCFMETLRKDGIRRGLYAGTVPALIANVAENSVLFAAYGVCQNAVAFCTSQEVGQMHPIFNAISGFLAGFFSSFTLCPTELIKCRLQAMRETTAAATVNVSQENIKPFKSVGPWKLTKEVFQQEGVLGFYRGLTSTFAREMPGYFFFFGGYELSRHLLTPHGKTKDDIGPLRTMICGGIGGVSLWTLVFPTDVVKSRIQVNKLNQTMIGCMTDIVRKEGVRALYNGLGPTLVRTFPATGALFLAYEYTHSHLVRLLV